ncbi:MAG: hypothetical protein AMXMBFR61_02180 [Fimbriimonadales bacterium]
MERPAKTDNFPQLTRSAYFAIREAFIRRSPARVDPTWVMAHVPGYQKERSARTVVSQLKRLSLIDADGTPTEIAKAWRTEDGYREACAQMLRAAFPGDIVDALSGTAPDAETVQRMLVTKGLGSQTARNVARLFQVLWSGEHAKSAGQRSSRRTGSSRQHDVGSGKTKRTGQPPSVATDSTPAATQVVVLRYFLTRGRMAELRVPDDLTRQELAKLFAHLRIDLLDETNGEP